MSKLTLSADSAVIADAKRLAAGRNTSVSALFGRMVVSLTLPDDDASPAIGPITRRASGMVRLPQGKTERQLLEDALSDKYGARK